MSLYSCLSIGSNGLLWKGFGMAKRKHELLNDAEGLQLIGIPDDRDQLARLSTFEPSDIEIVGV